MAERVRSLKNEKKLLIVLAFISLSAGMWTKYRQLWLESAGYTIAQISRILSVALICSSVVSFITSFFSSKIKVKNIVVLSFIFKVLSMICLLLFKNDYIIKICIILGVMCEIMFSISFYPLLSFESKSNNTYKKKMLIDYVFNDLGVVVCGFLVGVTFGSFVFDYNWCLIMSASCTLIAFLFLMGVNSSEEKIKKKHSFKSSIKKIFKNKINRGFLLKELVGYTAYGILFDLMMLVLTNYIGFDVKFTSIFIIISNMLGTLFSYLFSKVSKNYSISLSCIIKYGTRALIFFIAFLINKNFIFIFAIIYAYITARILEDKATGSFLQLIDEENQFLYGNLRYFTLNLGEGIGAFLAGILITSSLRLVFLGAGVFLIILTIVSIYLDYLIKKSKKS